MSIGEWSEPIYSEFAHFMLGDVLGSGMSRKVYQHPFDRTKVIKVENSASHFQNVLEWRIWQDFQFYEKVKKWLAPCHAISHNGTFLIMEKADDIPNERKIETLPAFLTDHKRSNFGLIKGQIVARDYALSRYDLSLRMKKWTGEE